MSAQIDIFGGPSSPSYPDGFRYESDVLPADQEHAALEQIRALPPRFHLSAQPKDAR